MRNDELYHYGVLGMKWGIRRGRSQLNNATSQEGHDKGRSTLTRTRDKSMAKIGKLETRHEKLTAKSKKANENVEFRKARYERKATKHLKKSKGLAAQIVPGYYAWHQHRSTVNLDRAAKLSEKAAIYKEKVAKNEKLMATMRKGVDEIDSTLIKAGKNYTG